MAASSGDPASGRSWEAPTSGWRGGVEGVGRRARALAGPVAACQNGRRRSGARLRRSVAAFGGASKDERTEDAGPWAEQVTEPGCGGRRLAFFRDPGC